MTKSCGKAKSTFWRLLAGTALGLTALGAHAQDKSLTLCWAAWDPANALVELSKDFTAKTGIQMKYEFVPWPNFAQRMLNELNSKGKLCDLLIGDSQWIGGAATEGHYVKLNEFFDKNGVKMSDFMPATVTGYSEWPKGTPNYWALPAMGDAVAFSYRKDWFARPELQAEFKQKYGHDLTPPKTWDEFKQIGQFFQGRKIDGKKVYGAALYTERGSEGITMGVTNTMYAYGFDYQNPAKPYDMKGYVNSAGAVKGLKLYKELYDTVTPPGHSNAYMTEDLDAYKSGQVAMQMQFIAFFPGISKDPQVGGEKTGFFPIPKGDKQFAMLGGQGISVVKYSDKKEMALEYMKWFAQPSVQKKWWDGGGFTCLKSILEAPGFEKSTPYAKVFLDSMKMVKDFWAEPSYASLLLAMQNRTHDYVVAGKGTPQQALDALVKDWTETFREDGKIK
jgi:multiple sugar transport system substrate-binding protein